jgi:glycosyltransferase involved in cell wall biosynthesis
MKIAFGTPYYVSGYGIENRITELINHLPSEIDKTILCLRYSRKPPINTSIIQIPVYLHLITGSRSVRFSSIARILQEEYFKKYLKDFDVVDTQYFPMTALPNFSKKVITWHSVTFVNYANSKSEAKILKKGYNAILQNMKTADLVMPVSKWAENEIKQFDNSIPTEVVPNGVDLKKFYFKPYNKRAKTIISIGRFTPHKGQLEAISIFEQVYKELKDDNLKLILAGKNTNKKYFEEVLKYSRDTGLKNISILTNIPDNLIPDIYQKGDVFLSCSHWEGFGMPMLEAQACGLPALGYSVCSHPEIVANQKFLSEENDTSSIVENIKKLLTENDYYWKEAIKARNFAEKYDWNNITNQYLSAIKNLVDS